MKNRLPFFTRVGRASKLPTALGLLFVDDEPDLLAAYKRALKIFRPEWKVSIARSGHDAMNQMKARGFDAFCGIPVVKNLVAKPLQDRRGFSTWDICDAYRTYDIRALRKCLNRVNVLG